MSVFFIFLKLHSNSYVLNVGGGIMKKTVDKTDMFLSKLISSKYTVITLASLILLLLLLMFFSKDLNYTVLLKEIATINITIAIGLGALSIAITNKFLDTDYIWSILVMLLLGVISHLLSIASLGDSISKLYFFANILCVVQIITSFSRYFEQLIKQNNNASNTNNSKSRKSRK